MTSLPPAASRVRLRQIALCVPDIWPVERQIADALEIAPVHRDPPNDAFAMKNVVFAVGDTFLEILQPVTPEAPSQRYLEKMGGAGGYMAILQVDDIARAKARVEALKTRIVWEHPPSPTHGIEASTIHLHPADTGGTLFSIDWMNPSEGWAWGGEAWSHHQHTDVVKKIQAAELTSADPDQLAERLSLLLDRPIGENRTIALDDSELRIVEGEAPREKLTAIDLVATDRSRVGEVLKIGSATLRFV